MTAALSLVPSERHAEAEAARGVRALSLPRFIRDLAALPEDAYREATPEITRLAIEQELRRGPGFAAMIDQALGVLRVAGVSSEELHALQLPRAQLLGNAMRALDERLAAHGLWDPRGDAGRAARALGATSPVLHGVSRVLVRGMTRWNALDLALLEALQRALRANGGEGVTLELPNLLGEHSAEAVHRLAQSLETRWAGLNDPPSLLHGEPRQAKTLDLALVEAADEAAEARAAVRAVQEALAAGARIDCIAIVPLDLTEPFLEPLREQLALARLPFTEPRGRPPIAGPKVHAALELMRQSHGPLSRDALLDILCMPGLRTQRWFGEAGEEMHFALLRELKTLPLRVDRTRTELCEALALRDDASGDESAARAALASAGMRALLNDLAKFQTLAPREAHGRAFVELFEDLGLLGSVPRSIGHALSGADAGASELLRALGDNAEGGRALVTAVQRCYEAARALGLEQEHVSPQALLAEVETALPGASQRGSAARAGAIVVGRAHELAGFDLDLAVVCQASSAKLDAGRGTAEIALGAELRAALPAERRPPSAADLRRSTLLALNYVLSRARRSVVSFARREGQSQGGPSRFFLALAAVQSKGHCRLIEPASQLSPKARRVAAKPLPSPDAERRAHIELLRAAFFLESEPRGAAHTGRVPTLAAQIGGDANRPIALTTVERYARCPFLGFGSAVLGATRDEAVGDAIGIRERGSLLHDALAVALEATRARWGSAARTELEATALEAARAFLLERGGSALRRAGLGATLADVAAFVRWSFDHPEYAFLEGERAFGLGRDWGPLVLGSFFVSGRIDRIDASTDRKRLRVIDYKSGRKPTRAERATQLLQPWLYAAKVGQELSAQHVETGYLSLNRRDPDWSIVYQGGLEGAAIQEARARALMNIEQFRQGHIEPIPKDTGSCRRCDARDLCRRPLSAPPQDEAGE